MQKTVYIRADGNSTIGLGHVFRCLAVAEMLKENFHLVFLIQNPSEFIKETILEYCDECISLLETNSFIAEAEEIADRFLTGNEVLVLDGYEFRTEYQTIVRGSGSKIIYIDDLHSFQINADAILNHASGITSEMYEVRNVTSFLLGPKYALLRNEFLNAASNVRNVDKIESAFICLGGADPNNYVKDVLEKALQIEGFNRLEVVVGNAYKHRASLDDLAKSANIEVKIHNGLSGERIAELISETQVGICSSSNISYEFCAVGGLLFIMQTADNQSGIHQFLLSEGLALEIADLNQENLDVSLFATQVANQRKFFDGNSPVKIQRALSALFTELEIEIAVAESAHVDQYFEWANDPIVRSNAIHTDPIPYENHVKWFNNKLKSEETVLYYFEYQGHPLGQVRFDKSDDVWEIDYSVDEKMRGKGMGSVILKMAISEIYHSDHAVNRIKGVVKSGNSSSERVFQHLGFKTVGKEWLKEQEYSVFLLLLPSELPAGKY